MEAASLEGEATFRVEHFCLRASYVIASEQQYIPELHSRKSSNMDLLHSGAGERSQDVGGIVHLEHIQLYVCPNSALQIVCLTDTESQLKQ